MKIFDCCHYCACFGNEDSCPCYNQNLEDIKNEFVCDFHIPNYTKIEDDVRADERIKTVQFIHDEFERSTVCIGRATAKTFVINTLNEIILKLKETPHE